jgi:hypothetical protein
MGRSCGFFKELTAARRATRSRARSGCCSAGFTDLLLYQTPTHAASESGTGLCDCQHVMGARVSDDIRRQKSVLSGGSRG